METDQKYLEDIILPLLIHPRDLKLSRKVDEMGVLLTVDCNSEDIGVVIGKEGVTAKAIRTLIFNLGKKNHSRISVKINAPEKR